MANIVKHKFTSGKAEGVDATLVRTSNWNAEHALAGGALGSLLVRDTGETDGAAWLAAVASGAILVSTGVGGKPIWSSSDPTQKIVIPAITGQSKNVDATYDGFIALEQSGADSYEPDIEGSHGSWLSPKTMPRLRISRPTGILDDLGDPETYARHFVMEPYRYGFAIDYPGCVECYVDSFSIHYNAMGTGTTGLWVGEQGDIGGLYIECNNTSLERAARIGNMLFDRTTPNGDMIFVLPAYGVGWSFQSGSGPTEAIRLSGPGDITMLGHLLITNTSKCDAILNNDFTSEIFPWVASSATAASVGGGEDGNCVQVTNTSGAVGMVVQAIKCALGAEYRLSWYHKNGTQTGKVRIGTTLGATDIYVSPAELDDAAWTNGTHDFIATAAVVYVSLCNSYGGGSPGYSTYYDTVTCVLLHEAPDLCFGDGSGSYPALDANGTELDVLLGDRTAWAPFAAKTVKAMAAALDSSDADVFYIGHTATPTTWLHKITASVSATASYAHISFRLATAASTWSEVLKLQADGAVTAPGTLNVGGTDAGTLSISKAQITCTIATDTNCSGKGTATITTSTGIPAGSLVLGVDARVTTVIAGSDGIASWALGYAGDTDAWGAALALAATTTTGIANFTVTSPTYFAGATNLTFTGTGGKVIDSGVIKLTIYYAQLTPIAA